MQYQTFFSVVIPTDVSSVYSHRPISEFVKMEEWNSWCMSNCKGLFKQSWTNDDEMLFESEEDALLFKLTFG